MSEPISAARRLRDSSWFPFVATTAALVLLASGGTVILVQFGADEGHAPAQALQLPGGQSARRPLPSSITVDRLVGTFGGATLGPAVSPTGSDGPSLSDLLTPPAAEGPGTATPPPEDPGGGGLPVTPPLPVDPGPQPTPPTVHPPVLPMPNPLPIPLPIPIPVLPTLPPIPLPLPGS